MDPPSTSQADVPPAKHRGTCGAAQAVSISAARRNRIVIALLWQPGEPPHGLLAFGRLVLPDPFRICPGLQNIGPHCSVPQQARSIEMTAVLVPIFVT